MKIAIIICDPIDFPKEFQKWKNKKKIKYHSQSYLFSLNVIRVKHDCSNHYVEYKKYKRYEYEYED